jgi:hypothetical protein
MRYVAVLVTLGAALAVSAPAAFACGDKVDCTIPFRSAQTAGPVRVVAQQAHADAVQMVGPTAPKPWWVEMRDQNFAH